MSKVYSCIACGKKCLDKDTIGINKKLLGEDITSFYCMDCLADYLGCKRRYKSSSVWRKNST